MATQDRGSGSELNLALGVPSELNPDGETVRVMGTWHSPYFCLRDLCRVLGDIRPDNAQRFIEAEDQQLFNVVTTGGIQRLVFITENGFYDLVLGSRSPRVRPFRKWVTREVLPSVRTYGCYPPPPPGAPAPMERPRRYRPWEERIRASVMVHHQYILLNLGKAHWSVFTALQIHMLITEDEFLRHNLPIDEKDLPDGSVGQRWPRFRRDKPWVMPVQFAPLAMPGRMVGDDTLVVPVAVYDPSEFQHFLAWFYTEYLPTGLPDYLRNKFKRIEFGFAQVSAADNVNRRLMGLPADLRSHEREAITDAGGFIPHTPAIGD